MRIFYEDVPSPKNEDSKPRKLLTPEELESALEVEKSPFKWAFGLIGGDDMEKESFRKGLAKQAAALNPRFAIAAPN